MTNHLPARIAVQGQKGWQAFITQMQSVELKNV
jgi:hypothetical protein